MSAQVLAAALIAIVIVIASVAALTHSPGAPGAPDRERPAGQGLLAIPPAAQGAVSGALGRDDPSYAARAVAGGLAVRNQQHGLTATFAAHRVEIRSGRVRLGLQLAGYGYGSALRPVASAAPRARANRVVYAHGDLQEWYVNGPLGLEQGFTLAAPPARRTAESLTLALALSGNLRGTLSGDSRGVTFADGRGASLAVRGLVATDADGRTLPSRMELERGRLLIRVDDARARYPLSIDPFFQQAELEASDAVGGDRFGSSVAISGDTIAVGAPFANIGANTQQGAIYVFTKPAGNWANATETAKLTASDGAEFESFGWSVAVSGTTIVAGARDANIGSNLLQGAAYVFVKPAGGWVSGTETAKLTASDGAAFDALGTSVAVSGDTIVSGARVASEERGAAYVFTQPAGGWVSGTETAKLTVSDGNPADDFGAAVAISGDTVVGTAPQAPVDAQLNAGPGRAYVFVKPAGGWANATETARLTASDLTQGFFGQSVAIEGGTIAVGAHNATFGGKIAQGAVYEFSEPAGGWATATQTAKLTASDGAQFTILGASVAISGDTIAAGAVGDLNSTGSVYAWVEPSGGWIDATETKKLISSDGVASDGLGWSLGMSGTTLVTGAFNQDPDPAVHRVRVHIFDLLAGPTEPSPDADGDGVDDVIDVGNGAFNDGAGTSGSIVSTNGLTVSVSDAAAPEGVHIVVSGAGAGPATVVVGGFTLRLNAPSDVVATSGSITVRVVVGAATIDLGGGTTVTVPAGVTARVTDTGGGGFSVQNLGGGTVTVTRNGVPTSVTSGHMLALDTSPPVIAPVLTGTLGSNGWYRSNVSVTWIVADAQSAISSRTGCGQSSVTSDTAGRTFTCSATSRGGTATQSVTVKRDATAPTAAFAAHAATYTVDQTVAFGCTTSDAGSGVATACSGVSAPASSFPLGLNTRTSTAGDLAGNTRTISTTFRISVTGASLCNLTRQLVQGSTKYLVATTAQRAAVNLVVAVGCTALNSIRSNTSTAQKRALVAAYRVTVGLLAQQAWLSGSQAGMLDSLSNGL